MHAEIAARLVASRERVGLSIDDVSLMMMAPRDVLARLEKGQFAPEPHQSEALARIYGVSVEYIMTGDETRPALAPTKVVALFSQSSRSDDVSG